MLPQTPCRGRAARAAAPTSSLAAAVASERTLATAPHLRELSAAPARKCPWRGLPAPGLHPRLELHWRARLHAQTPVPRSMPNELPKTTQRTQCAQGISTLSLATDTPAQANLQGERLSRRSPALHPNPGTRAQLVGPCTTKDQAAKLAWAIGQKIQARSFEPSHATQNTAKHHDGLRRL